MADDLDDLLDEIEGSLEPSQPTHPSVHIQPPRKTIKTTEHEDDIDNIIDDICTDDDPLPVGQTHKPSLPSSHNSCVVERDRCKIVLLGGSRMIMGLCDRDSQRSCDKLRCTGCDFSVLYFNDMIWHTKCDYLFFRNNMPNRDKLKSNLIKRKGYRAYSCQCSWVSMDTTIEVSTLPNLKWVCGRHQIPGK